jgi:hypothetical protein
MLSDSHKKSIKENVKGHITVYILKSFNRGWYKDIFQEFDYTVVELESVEKPLEDALRSLFYAICGTSLPIRMWTYGENAILVVMHDKSFIFDVNLFAKCVNRIKDMLEIE